MNLNDCNPHFKFESMDIYIITTQNKLEIYDSKMSLLNSIQTEILYDICFPIQDPKYLTYFGYSKNYGKFIKFQVNSNHTIRIYEEGYIENIWSVILPNGHDNSNLFMYSYEFGYFRILELKDKKMILNYKDYWNTGWTSLITFKHKSEEYYLCYNKVSGEFYLGQFNSNTYKEIQKGEWLKIYDYIITIDLPTCIVILCYSSLVGSYVTFTFTGSKLEEGRLGILPERMQLLKIRDEIVLLDTNNGNLIYYQLIERDLKEPFKISASNSKNFISISKSTIIPYFTVMSFNVWTSSSNTYKGIEAVAQIIRENNVDIIGLQEMGIERMSKLQEALGHNYTCHYSTGIVTRYKIKKIYENQKGIHVWGVIIELPNSKEIKVFNSHLTAFPYGPYLLREYKFDVERTKNEINEIQAKEIKNGIEYFIYQSENYLPVLLLGDHNIPSHLDHNDMTSKDEDYYRERNCKVVIIDWPVSFILKNNGFIDSFREVHPNVLKNYGFTWSPGYPKGVLEKEEIQDRIDFVYHKNLFNLRIKTFEAYTVDSIKDLQYPSDHRAVVVKFEFGD